MSFKPRPVYNFLSCFRAFSVCLSPASAECSFPLPKVFAPTLPSVNMLRLLFCHRAHKRTSAEEVWRARSGGVPRAEASVPCIARCHPPSTWMCVPTGRLPESHHLRVLWGFCFAGTIGQSLPIDDRLNLQPLPLPAGWGCRWGGKVQASSGQLPS